MSIDLGYVLGLVLKFLAKLPATLLLTVGCFAGGLVLAFGIFWVRNARIPVVSQLADVFVSFGRSVPVILQLFIVYYGLPQLLSLTVGVDLGSWNKITFAAVTLVGFDSAYLAEVLRGAYLAVDREQIMLAQSLGYGPVALWGRVVLPQMLGIALPDLGNALIKLLHNTTLLFTIGIVDIMGLADIIVSNNYGIRQAEVYLAVGLVYWVASAALELLVKLCRRFNKYSVLVTDQIRLEVAA
ncbi:amino acid ABC transporter permease [Bifidobacterium choloepi]|uniref:Amino acid ABC transporter permease n=1 Tax=Bifidobacterium choloepi TaxID=2614131 RepID=A0A6I5MYB7_9BIFI|nr:amino acid ABC transporter permease [Bifidobacterium choloepi]NEG69598.1 amino acid ABC transporter permease [Bifidobacterium choloepi]